MVIWLVTCNLGTNIAYKKRVRVAISTPNGEEVIEIPELTDGLFNNVQDSVCLPIHTGSEYALYFQMGGGPVHFLMLNVEGNRRVASMSCITIPMTCTQALYQMLMISRLGDLKTGR